MLLHEKLYLVLALLCCVLIQVFSLGSFLPFHGQRHVLVASNQISVKSFTVQLDFPEHAVRGSTDFVYNGKIDLATLKILGTLSC